MQEDQETGLALNLVVVLPTFNDNKSIKFILRDLTSKVTEIFEVIVVDDGSDQEILTIKELEKISKKISILRLPYNCGHQIAISIGLKFAVKNFPGKTICVMDGDGEDSANGLNTLLENFKSQSDRIHVAKRGRRVAPAWFSVCYFVYNKLFFFFTGKQLNFGNFILLPSEDAMELVKIRWLPVHFAATVIKFFETPMGIKIDRSERFQGQSKMNFLLLCKHAYRSLMVFDDEIIKKLCGISTLTAITFGVLTCLLATENFLNAAVYRLVFIIWVSVLITFFLSVLAVACFFKSRTHSGKIILIVDRLQKSLLP